MSVNKVILIGNLGQKPEIKYTSSKQPVTNFSLATTERWFDKEGKKQQKTEWHKIVVWGKQAEHCVQYLDKGRECYIEGKLTTRDWEDKQGNKRTTTEVLVSQVVFLSDKEKSIEDPDAPIKKTEPEIDFGDIPF